MNREILLLLRVPFLDRIPSLKTLIVFLSKQGFRITIVSSYNTIYPTLDFQSDKISVKLVKERRNQWGLPTSVKLIATCFNYYIRRKTKYIIGGDSCACSLLRKISKVYPIKYVNFLLEYPDISNPREAKVLKDATYIITHDRWHGEFLMKHYGIDKKKLLYLPNASHTPIYQLKSTYLSDGLNIPSDKRILLHSGGLGVWFQCKELAKSTEQWDDDYVLVFHTSHQVETTPYYKEMTNEIQLNGKVFYSTKPVSNEVLDELVASAYIGVALYSVDVLGYRALYMGLAAGKIGNYLKCGKPVIATRLPSLSYIEEYQCGVLVDDVSQVKGAMIKIAQNYDFYSENAYRCYQEMWEPQQYLVHIQESIWGTKHETKI